MMDLPSLKNIKELDISGKRVLLRADFNVAIKDGIVADDFRVIKSLPTIKYLKEKGARVILISHLTDKSQSLKPVADYIKDNLFPDADFIPEPDLAIVKNAVAAARPGDIILLENVRMFKGEEENDVRFSSDLAECGDIYVNNAFSASHRKHATIIGLPKILPHLAGFLFEEEVNNLSKAFNPARPFLLMLGGVKFESKLGVLKKFVDIADKVFIGGALANNFFKATGVDIKSSVFDEDFDVSPYIGNRKIILPDDVRWEADKILDIGEKGAQELKRLIAEANFIVWNGPLGNYEIPGFSWGTEEAIKALSLSGAEMVIGGGNTIDAIRRAPEDRLSRKENVFLSTGGGAMLAFLANGTLPGIEALNA